MDHHFGDWLNLFVRWAHLIAGISWIGSSFYFMWLDASLEKPVAIKKDVEGELWMVHSGGFYLVERKRIGPGSMPKTLHWFKYEALFTWITGFFLLCLIYYFTQGAYLIDPSVSSITATQGTMLGIGTLIASWFIYDFVWQKLGKNYSTLATAISVLGAFGAGFIFCHFLSGRAAFIHMGALFGTCMVANVWVRILPAQQKMIDATARGETPDFTLSGHAKRRSVHNTYMTFPVLFMMLSNHYPAVYAGKNNGLVLVLLILMGACIRHVMVAKKETGKLAAIPALASFIGLVFLASTPLENSVVMTASAPVKFQQVQEIIGKRCVYCHSLNPIEKTFGPSPGGIHFDSPQIIHAFAPRIKFRAVQTKTMPLGNKTGITEEERTILGRWVDQGAQVE